MIESKELKILKTIFPSARLRADGIFIFFILAFL